jgi:hypothetical protein
MDAETIATRTTLATHMRALAQAGRPKMEIVLLPGDGRHSEHRPASPAAAAAAAAAAPSAYTTGDHIHGEVVVTTALHESRFDQLEISFDGAWILIFFSFPLFLHFCFLLSFFLFCRRGMNSSLRPASSISFVSPL